MKNWRVHWGILAMIGFTLGSAAQAEIKLGDDWKQFENGHFIAYSDEKKKKVITLLEELERFRAAFLQISVITVPDDAPKTLVILPRRKSDFNRMAYTGGLGGFAQNLPDQTIIVMPARGKTESSEATIRHELGHALLNYQNYSYPLWFNEGFAEFLSSIEVDPDTNRFALGEAPMRVEVDANLILDWNDVLDEDFNPHEYTDARLGSIAYAQSWLLVHYIVLGDQGRNSPKLQRYLGLVNAGTDTSEAFETAFGTHPDNLWDEVLKTYVGELPVYTMSLKEQALDLDFEVSPAPIETLRPMISYYENLARANRDPDYIRNPLAKVGGHWAPSEFGQTCGETFQMYLDQSASRMTWERSGAEQSAIVGEFTWSNVDQTTVQVSPAEGSEVDFDALGQNLALLTTLGLDMTLQMPANDLLCLRPVDFESDFCTVVLQRCNSG